MTDSDKRALRDRAATAFDRTIALASSEPVAPDPETLARLEAAVRSLPKLRREIFLAVRLDDMSYAEIAAVTGLSERQVQRHVARAIAHISCFMDGREVQRPWWRRWLRLP